MAIDIKPRIDLKEMKERRNPFKPLKSVALKFLLFVLGLATSLLIVTIFIFTVLAYGGDIDRKLGLFPCPGNSLSMNLVQNLTEEELLWKASLVHHRKSYPFERVPKLAFMFLTKGPLPLYQLWEKFFEGHENLYSIYIHSLPSYEADFPRSSPFYGRQIPSKVAEWGTVSICEAERRLLANALLDLSNEWFILLSESCIPLVNFGSVHSYLLHSGQSFIASFDDPSLYGRGRYDPNMAPEIKLSDWRKGWQWFQINRLAAIAIVKDEIFYPKFRDYCHPKAPLNCYSDEHYFPTLLTYEMADQLANRTLTWIDWSRGGAHPATFGENDVSEAFLRDITKGEGCSYNGGNSTLCYLFARKFSPSSLGRLIDLAPQVMGFG